MSYVKMLKNGDIPQKQRKKKPLTPYDRMAIEKRAGAVEKVSDYAFKAPKNIADAERLVGELSLGKAVMVSLEKADAVNAERILDFLSGAAYALSGRVESIGGLKFMLVPKGVEIVFAGD